VSQNQFNDACAMHKPQHISDILKIKHAETGFQAISVAQLVIQQTHIES